MTEKTLKRFLDLKAMQDAGTQMLCPRCGLTQLKHPVTTNALSRIADIYICDACGTAEAMLAYMRQTQPIHQWEAFKPQRIDAGFLAMPATEVLAQVIQKQSDELARLFRLCLTDPDHAMEYRNEAFENCPGLTELWVDPFNAKYKAADGAVLIQFRSTEDGVIQMTAGMSEK